MTLWPACRCNRFDTLSGASLCYLIAYGLVNLSVCFVPLFPSDFGTMPFCSRGMTVTLREWAPNSSVKASFIHDNHSCSRIGEAEFETSGPRERSDKFGSGRLRQPAPPTPAIRGVCRTSQGRATSDESASEFGAFLLESPCRFHDSSSVRTASHTPPGSRPRRLKSGEF